MITLQRLSDSSGIADSKTAYLMSLTSPMDGMWDTGFTNPSPHYELLEDEAPAGYVAISDENVLLQFYVRPKFLDRAGALLDHVIRDRSIETGVVSTTDSLFLSLCLDRSAALTVSTLLYEMQSPACPDHPESTGTELRLVLADEVERTTDLQNICLGAEPGEHEWLIGYSSNLINRKELFVLERGNEWVGLGEFRRSDTQSGIADLGMMVDPDHRGKGWATYILGSLKDRCLNQGLTPICSTTVENIASRKAIERAGFGSRNRIADVRFEQ
jgi:GNAT superfamily N-acetyltransferase